MPLKGHDGDGYQGQDTVRQFRLTRDYTVAERIDIDTAFTHFHRSRIADSFSPFNAYPGNYGLPFYQINFFDRVHDPDKFLYRYYYPFIYTPERAIFMDNRVPFTELFFTYAGPAANVAEQNFRVRSSLNINRHLNIGLIYDIIYSIGHYSHQKASNKNFLLHSSYIRDRYKAYAALGINNHFANQNGGVVDMSTIREFDTRDVPVNLGGLNRAIGTLRNRSLLFVQSYTPFETITGSDDEPDDSGVSGTFTHILTIEGNNRSYYDASPGAGFYDTTFFNNVVTYDSLHSSVVNNSGRFDFSFRSRGGVMADAGVGIRHEHHRYGQMWGLPDSLLADTTGSSHNNVALTGRIETRIGGGFGLRARGELFFAGERAGDFDLRGAIEGNIGMQKGPLTVTGSGGISLTSPSLWQKRWISNHFMWDTEPGQELRIDAGGRIDYPGRQFKAAFNYAVIDNHRFFDSGAMPARYSGALSVAALSLDKIFSLGNFHQGNTLLIQQSTNSDVLPLPLLTFRAGLWWERNIHFEITGGNLLLQAGAEVFMHTPYYAMGYMPATGIYYNQNLRRTGNYPFVNVFLNAKIKRTRILLSFDHLNAGFSGTGYDMVPRHPVNDRVFRYGIAWTFYD